MLKIRLITSKLGKSIRLTQSSLGRNRSNGVWIVAAEVVLMVNVIGSCQVPSKGGTWIWTAASVPPNGRRSFLKRGLF